MANGENLGTCEQAHGSTARELLIEKLAKALWNQEIADEVKTSGKPAEYFAQWPEDSRIQPYCRRTYRQAEAVTNIAEAYAADQVRQADQQSLVDNEQLNDEILALQAEIAQLRQERDALKVHLSQQPTSMDEITFREGAGRAEVQPGYERITMNAGILICPSIAHCGIAYQSSNGYCPLVTWFL